VKRKLWVVCAVVVLTLAVSAAGAEVQRTVLENGLVVLTKEVHAAPIVSTVIVYRVGSRNEELGQTGKSHFLEHMLFKGTDRYRKGEIDLITLRNGGANNAFTGEDYTAYFFNFSSDRWQVALEIEANRMTNNTFVPAEYNPEKQVVIEELKINLDSPWGALWQEVQATAFREHPYRNPVVGWIQDLERATAEEMEAYYRRFYHPNNAVLVIVGDFETQPVLARVRELFGSISRGPDAPPLRIVEPAQRGEKRVAVKKATNLERLLVAWKAPAMAHPDSYALQLASALLSRGKTSRLYQRLVERDQSVVFARTSFDEAIDPTLFSLQAELKPGYKLADVERAALEEVEQLTGEEVAATELEKAKNLIEAEFILDNETTLFQAVLVGLAEAMQSHTYLDTYIENIRRVTPADVQRVARTYLTADKRTVGWLVPEPESRESEKRETGNGSGFAFGGRQAARGRVGGLKASAAVHPAEPSPQKTERKPKRGEKPAPPPAPLRFEIRPGLAGERRVLANGLTLLLARNPNLPAVALAGVVKAGSRTESDAEAGVATLMSRLLTEGTKTRSALEIATAIESVGGSLTASAGYESSVVTATVLKKDFDLALDLARDVLMNPAFAQDRVARERDRQLAEIRSAQDRPQTVASWTFNELVFAGHPRHRPPIGYAETVGKLTRDTLLRFHERHFAPTNTVLAVVGDINLEETARKVEAAFAAWTPKSIEPPQLPALRRQSQRVAKYVPMEKEQVNVYLGHLGIDRANPDYYALQVLDTILGGGPGFTSRIPGHLRDEQGLAYSTFSDITGSADLDPGRFIAYIGASPENLDQALAGIVKEIETIVAEPVTETELADAQAYLTGSFVFEFETNAEIARFLLDAELYQLGFDYIVTYPEKIRAVRVADVQRVARRYLDPKNYTVVVVGPVDEQGRPRPPRKND